MYDPPTENNYHRVGRLSASFKEAYDKGYNAAREGFAEDDNPYEPSGHERDTTFKDDLNYYWYSGFIDYEGE